MRIHPLIALADFSSEKSCTSLEEQSRCTSDCTSLFTDCTIQCDGDPVCASGCNRDYAYCSDLCPCNKKCEYGCPCPFSSQYCSGVSGIHILAFNPYTPDKQGNVNNQGPQFKFSWFKTSEEVFDLSNHLSTPKEFNDDRSKMCSFQLRDRMIMIGGSTQENSSRQFRVNPHSMGVEQLDDLPFAFLYGSCHEYNQDFALACAGNDNKDQCWELSGVSYQWNRVGDTNYPHYSGDLAKFKKTAIIVGGCTDELGTTEIFDPFQKKWIVKNTNQDFAKMYAFDVVGFRETAYLFGGTIKVEPRPDDTRVWQLAEDASKWTRHPQHLKNGRQSFRSLVQANTIIHIGGKGDQKLEFWEWDDVMKTFHVSESKHSTSEWFKYPEVFLVRKDEFTNSPKLNNH